MTRFPICDNGTLTLYTFSRTWSLQFPALHAVYTTSELHLLTASLGRMYSRSRRGRVVTRTIADGRTMAAESSVTWTHCSVHMKLPGGKMLTSARMRPCIRADIGMLPYPPAPHPRPPPVPPRSPYADGLMRPHGRSSSARTLGKKLKILKILKTIFW
jgi:hypothetical protein